MYCQVSCMSVLCGMVPFANPHIPDQGYRLLISIFIHSGSVLDTFSHTGMKRLQYNSFVMIICGYCTELERFLLL